MTSLITPRRLLAMTALLLPAVVAAGTKLTEGEARELYEPRLNLGLTHFWVAAVVAIFMVVLSVVQGRSRRVLKVQAVRTHRMVGDRGGVTPFVLLFIVPMVLMAGLAFDGGRVLTERRAALDVAQNAALAAVQAVDGASIRQGGTDVNVGSATTAAQNFLASQGYSGSVTVAGDTVTVTVTKIVNMQLMSAVGVGSKTVTGVGRARIVRGVQGAET